MERIRKIKIATSLSVLFLFALVLIVIGQVVSIATLSAKKVALERELQMLGGETSSVEELIKYRESDRYVEQYAREVLGMTKDGEESHDGK